MDESKPLAAKVAYVKRQGQTRNHTCHWPNCDKQVPPAKWGCKEHWRRLPYDLRVAIWHAYVPGQEINMSPSREYVEVARRVQDWIMTRLFPQPKDVGRL